MEIAMTARFLALAVFLIAVAGSACLVSAQPAPPGPGTPPPGLGGPGGGPSGPGPGGPGPGPPGPGPSPYWGAIAFTADGSYSSAWKMPSKAEAEAKVAVGCAKFGRGKCEVVSFRGELCV